MRIWLIEIGEPLPTDGHNDRLLRYGLLANKLIERGHKVVWWTSTFDHARKRNRYCSDKVLHVNDRYQLRLLHSIGYKKNISIRRIINQIIIANKLSKLSKHENPPDIILCCVPTIEFSVAAVDYGKAHGVPVILDVQDLWPDIYFDILPVKLRQLIKTVYHRIFRSTRKVFTECTSITGVSESYLQWGLSYAGRSRNEHDSVFPLGYQKPVFSAEQLAKGKQALTEIDIDEAKFTCWFVGSFGRTYDLLPVIDAARQIEKQGIKDTQFILSGNGEKNHEWKSAAQGLTNIFFTGWIDSNQIAYLMSIAQVGLMAYAKGAPQGLPYKIFEYLSAGLPILSSLDENGEAAHLLKTHECGFTYAAGNSNSFMEKLGILMSNSELRKKMGGNALALFEKHFDADAVYVRLAEYLEKMATDPNKQQKTQDDVNSSR